MNGIDNERINNALWKKKIVGKETLVQISFQGMPVQPSPEGSRKGVQLLFKVIGFSGKLLLLCQYPSR